MRLHPTLRPVLFLALATLASACASRPSDEGLEPELGSTSSALTGAIAEVSGFGTNPGALKMFEYVPAGLGAQKPLVLVLHGCTETAAAAAQTGWNELADEVGFTVVYPEQQFANNSARCFNWAGEYGVPDNLVRGKGENLSIKQMVDKAIAAHSSDPKRVFVVGFSAGGGTAAIMTATYPDVFAGGATIAGLPFNCTTTYSEVTGCMKPGKTKTAAEWATLVKAADAGFTGPWPRMSIWQGSADTTVAPANRTELVKQWAGVHGVDGATPVTDTVDGQPHVVYKNAGGQAVVETYEVTGMAHGVPVLPSAACGKATMYAVDKGICASRRIATFFGITAGGSGGGGADGGTGTSGGLSSSSSTGGVQPDGGSSGGSNAAGGDGPEGRHGSTCAVARPVGSAGGESTFALLGSILTLGIVLARSRRRSVGCTIAAATLGTFGCLTSNGELPPKEADGGASSAAVTGDPTKNEANKDVIPYRDLATHPGCTTAGLDARKASAYIPATIPDYKCAAKAYPLGQDDPKKPIVLLVHGNSSTPADWEKFPADQADALPMLADRLVAQSYRVLAVDVRYDKVDDPHADNKTENAGLNFDHGWAVPILEHFIDSVMKAFPDRELSLVAFSVGPTIARDALRRLHRAGKKPFERFKDLVFAAGSHHGVSSFRTLCGTNPTMRGKIACELGDRTSFTPTTFLAQLNGPGGAWETPCADGETAYGQKGVCGGHKVTYTTVVMKDVKEGTYQDEFVSEGSSKLAGANNQTVDLTANDLSNYFYNGLFKNHMGSIRSEAALGIIVKALGGTS